MSIWIEKLKKKKKNKRKRNVSETGVKEDRKKRITFVDSLYGLSQDDDDTLPDLGKKFHDDQSPGISPFMRLSNFTGKQSLNGDHDVSDTNSVTGSLDISGVSYLISTPLNGNHVTGSPHFNGDQNVNVIKVLTVIKVLIKKLQANYHLN